MNTTINWLETIRDKNIINEPLTLILHKLHQIAPVLADTLDNNSLSIKLNQVNITNGPLTFILRKLHQIAAVLADNFDDNVLYYQ